MPVFTRLLAAFAVLVLIGGGSPVQVLALTVNTLVDEQDGSVTDGDVSLRDALALAPAGDTIRFSVTGTIRLTRGQLNVTKPVIITGPGRTLLIIDASGSDPTPTQKNGDGRRAVFVSDNNSTTTIPIVMRAVTIKGGDVAGDGGGILTMEDLLIDDCEISNSACTGSGGGVCSGGPKLVVSSSSLFANSAKFGGGGAFVATGLAEFTHLYARGNTAVNGGGVYGKGGTELIFFRGKLQDNVASEEGGGVRTTGRLTVNRTIFQTNHARAVSPDGILAKGGGVCVTNSEHVVIVEAIFTGNTAAPQTIGLSFGGGMYCGNSRPIISNCQFTNCFAQLGGGLFNRGFKRCYVETCTFNSCVAAVDGGGIAFEPESAPPLAVVEVPYIRWGSFNSNRGSAIHVKGVTLGIEDVTFNSNTGERGGAIYVTGAGLLNVSRSIFQNNSASTVITGFDYGGKGGAIYLREGGAYGLALTECILTGNTATKEGGAIFVDNPIPSKEPPPPIIFTRTTLAGNRAKFTGGGLHLAAGRVNLIGSTITDNQSEIRTGGDVFLNPSTQLGIDSTSTVRYIAGPGQVIRN